MSNVVFHDGLNDYVDCGNGVSLQIVGSYSISGRIYVPKLITGGCVIGKSAGSGLSGGFLLYCTGTQWANWLSDGVANSDEILTTRTQWDVGRWYHIVGTFSNVVNGLKIYIDGQKDNQKTPVPVAPGNTLTTARTGTYNVTNFIRANYAEIQIYNRALSDSEVLYNFMHPGNPIKRGIQLNLTQDSIFGAQWQDLSGNGNHGTYVGGAVPQVANLLAGR